MQYVGYLWGSDTLNQELTIQLCEGVSGYQFITTYTDSDVRHTDWPELRKAIAKAKGAGVPLFIPKLDRLLLNVSFLTVLHESGIDFYCHDFQEEVTPETLPKVIEFATRHEQNGQANRTKAITKAHDDKAKAEYSEVAPLVQKWRGKGLSLQEIADKLNEQGHRTRRGKEWTRMQVSRVFKRFNGENEGR